MLTVTLKQAGLVSSPHFIETPNGTQGSKVAYSGHVLGGGLMCLPASLGPCLCRLLLTTLCFGLFFGMFIE